jgi:hypothetical protein
MISETPCPLTGTINDYDKEYDIPTENLLELLFAADRVYESKGHEIVDFFKKEFGPKTEDEEKDLLHDFFRGLTKRPEVDLQDQVIAAEAHEVMLAHFTRKVLTHGASSMSHWENFIKKLLTTTDASIKVKNRNFGMFATFPRIYLQNRADHNLITELKGAEFDTPVSNDTTLCLTFKQFESERRNKHLAGKNVGRFMDDKNRLYFAELGDGNHAVTAMCNRIFKKDMQYEINGNLYIQDTFFGTTYGIVFNAYLVE